MYRIFFYLQVDENLILHHTFRPRTRPDQQLPFPHNDDDKTSTMSDSDALTILGVHAAVWCAVFSGLSFVLQCCMWCGVTPRGIVTTCKNFLAFCCTWVKTHWTLVNALLPQARKWADGAKEKMRRKVPRGDEDPESGKSPLGDWDIFFCRGPEGRALCSSSRERPTGR